MKGFVLDERLASETHWLADAPLSQLRLMDDQRFSWLVLVPRLVGASEWVDLALPDQIRLWHETRLAAALLRTSSACDKINIGALGNVVAQLHVHVVARTQGDAAWPAPVWGSGPALRMEPAVLAASISELRGRWQELVSADPDWPDASQSS